MLSLGGLQALNSQMIESNFQEKTPPRVHSSNELLFDSCLNLHSIQLMVSRRSYGTSFTVSISSAVPNLTSYFREVNWNCVYYNDLQISKTRTQEEAFCHMPRTNYQRLSCSSKIILPPFYNNHQIAMVTIFFNWESSVWAWQASK